MSEKLSYSDQLKHPKWQKRRLEMLNAQNFCCQRCKSNEDTLHVHHRRYVKGRNVWEYDDSELVVLCEFCHQEEHENSEFINKLIFLIPDEYRQDFTSLLAGISYVFTSDNEILKNSEPLMFMAGIAAIKCRELDLEGMEKLSEFLKYEVDLSIARKLNKKAKYSIGGK
jgi:hypothetical protein